MNREKAIKLLKEQQEMVHGEYREALEMVITFLNCQDTKKSIEKLLTLLELQALLITNPMKRLIVRKDIKLIRGQVHEYDTDLDDITRFISSQIISIECRTYGSPIYSSFELEYLQKVMSLLDKI